MDSGEALEFQSGSRVCKNDIPWKKEERERTTRYDKERVHAPMCARERGGWNERPWPVAPLTWVIIAAACAGSPHSRVTRSVLDGLDVAERRALDFPSTMYEASVPNPSDVWNCWSSGSTQSAWGFCCDTLCICCVFLRICGSYRCKRDFFVAK